MFFNTAGHFFKRCSNATLLKSSNDVQTDKILLINKNILQHPCSSRDCLSVLNGSPLVDNLEEIPV